MTWWTNSGQVPFVSGLFLTSLIIPFLVLFSWNFFWWDKLSWNGKQISYSDTRYKCHTGLVSCLGAVLCTIVVHNWFPRVYILNLCYSYFSFYLKYSCRTHNTLTWVWQYSTLHFQDQNMQKFYEKITSLTLGHSDTWTLLWVWAI